MKFAAPSNDQPHYRLQKVTVDIKGIGAFDDLVKRQIEVACRTGKLGGMDPLDIRVDKRSPDSATLAVYLVKRFGFKLNPDSQECYYDTKEELKRRAVVEMEADRMIGTGDAKLLGHAVAGDGSPCSFYVVANPAAESHSGEKGKGMGVADGDLFRVKVNAKDGVRTILDESTAGYRQDLHACKLMAREVEYDAVRVYEKAVKGVDLPFDPKESAHLAASPQQAMERYQSKEPWEGIKWASTQPQSLNYPLHPSPASSQEPSKVEEKKLPPPLPQAVPEKTKSKGKKVAEKTVEKAPTQTPSDDNLPY